MGWDYALSWLVVLPFEITAAGLTIKYWRTDINIGVWIAVFLIVLSAIQIFGVRGYGEGSLPFDSLAARFRGRMANLGQQSNSSSALSRSSPSLASSFLR